MNSYDEYDYENLDNYDPLAGDEDDEEKDSEDEVFQGYIKEPEQENTKEPEPELSPKERIEHLFLGMPGRKKILLQAIGYCREAKEAADVDAFIDELQEISPSVYAGSTLRIQLVKAGALEECAAVEGEELEQGSNIAAEQVPDTENDDFYSPIDDSDTSKWFFATEVGLEFVDGQNAKRAIEELVESDKKYLHIYKAILTMCEGGPQTKQAIDATVDNDPVAMEKPRRWSGSFLDGLEASGAIEWNQGWLTTTAGREWLTALES